MKTNPNCLYTKTEEEIKKICRERGLSPREADLCVDWFVNQLRHKEVAEKYDITAQYSANLKSEMTRLLLTDKKEGA